MNRLNRVIDLVQKGRSLEADGWTARGRRIDGPGQPSVCLKPSQDEKSPTLSKFISHFLYIQKWEMSGNWLGAMRALRLSIFL